MARVSGAPSNAESDIRLTLIEPGAVVGSGAFRPLFVAFRQSIEVLAQSLALIVYVVVFSMPWVVRRVPRPPRSSPR
jgi:hypothetical protein